MTCDYCHGPLPEDARRGQRFCCGKCRSAWHRANILPGEVTGIRALKNGWAVTVRYPEIPAGVNKGSAVRIDTYPIRRQNASSGPENA